MSWSNIEEQRLEEECLKKRIEKHIEERLEKSWKKVLKINVVENVLKCLETSWRCLKKNLKYIFETRLDERPIYLLDKHFLLRKRPRNSTPECPWLSRGLINASHTQASLFKAACKTKTQDDLLKHKHYKTVLTFQFMQQKICIFCVELMSVRGTCIRFGLWWMKCFSARNSNSLSHVFIGKLMALLWIRNP